MEKIQVNDVFFKLCVIISLFTFPCGVFPIQMYFLVLNKMENLRILPRLLLLVVFIALVIFRILTRHFKQVKQKSIYIYIIYIGMLISLAVPVIQDTLRYQINNILGLCLHVGVRGSLMVLGIWYIEKSMNPRKDLFLLMVGNILLINSVFCLTVNWCIVVFVLIMSLIYWLQVRQYNK